MWVTISPISSMWPITSSRDGDSSKPCLGDTRASGVPTTSVLDLGEGARGVAPHGRGRGLIARRPARGEQVEQDLRDVGPAGALACRPPRRGAHVAQQLSQDVLEDASVAEVLGLARRVDAHARVELDRPVRAIGLACVQALGRDVHLGRRRAAVAPWRRPGR